MNIDEHIIFLVDLAPCWKKKHGLLTLSIHSDHFSKGNHFFFCGFDNWRFRKTWCQD